MAEVVALKVENQYQKQKRACRKGYIQPGRSMTIQEGLESIHNEVVIEQSQNNTKNLDPESLNEQRRNACIKAARKCNKCGSFEHNARTCTL